MYRIKKSISFCYGHRLLGYQGKCSDLHGHNAVATIELLGEDLDEQGILYDFALIKADVGQWIDDEIDHKLLLKHDDPLIKWLDQAGESYVVTQENPTAEHIAKMIFDRVKAAGYPVDRVTLAETPTNKASYQERP
jgi:6-pyruvoyltetrahydropterin/6-carboxytetrahydropterin synthase